MKKKYSSFAASATLTPEIILDRIFSTYIRIRDVSAPYGKCKCITCKKPLPWTEMDCGHYMGRGANSTRYNEQNCNAQCKDCNQFRDGKREVYASAIDEMYGQGTAECIDSLSRQTKKYFAYEYRELSELYLSKIKVIALEKNLDVPITRLMALLQ